MWMMLLIKREKRIPSQEECQTGQSISFVTELTTPLSSRNCVGSQCAFYAHDYYLFVVSNMCNEEGLVLVDEVQTSKK